MGRAPGRRVSHLRAKKGIQRRSLPREMVLVQELGGISDFWGIRAGISRYSGAVE